MRSTGGAHTFLRVAGAISARDETGRPSSWSGFVENMTEIRKHGDDGIEFVGLVSHELRNAVTVIMGMSELLAGGDVGATDIGDVAREIAGAAQDLEQLVEALSLLSGTTQLEEGTGELLPLSQIAADVLRAQQRLDPSRVYELQAPSVVDRVHGDRRWLEQAISNLVVNAAKYSTTGAPVTVLIERQGPELLLHVLDEGQRKRGERPQADEYQQMFEAFYRSPRLRRSASGTGLGLAVVARAVDKMGGRVWARSRPERGSDIGFSLPARITDHVSAPALRADAGATEWSVLTNGVEPAVSTRRRRIPRLAAHHEFAGISPDRADAPRPDV